MKVLLVAPRRFDSEDIDFGYLFPLGLAYISSALKQAGHQVDCFNLSHYRGPAQDIIHESVKEEKHYDFVCTGGLSTAYKQIKLVVDSVRKFNSEARIILGGGLISSEPELMFNALNPDFIVIGEGERAIVELLSCVENNGDLNGVLGIGYRDKSGKIICNKPQPAIMDLDSLPWPDFEGFEFETYLNNLKPNSQYFYDLYDFPRVYPIICSRSCPYRCTFCFHPLGNKYRQRSMDSIMQELEFAIKRYRINLIAIYDELFSHDKERVYEFCKRLKKLQEGIRWEIKWGCQMRVNNLDEELLKAMKDAGCYMVSYGFESYSPAILNSMKKHIAPKQIDQAVCGTLKHNLSIQANFIFGDRAETLQTAHETLDYWKENYHAGIMLGFINPYPGTALYKYACERGIIKDKLDFVENHIFDVINLSDAITDQEFEKLRLEIFEARMKHKISATPISLKKESGVYNFRVKCPHCGDTIEYKNYLFTRRTLFSIAAYCRKCRHRFFIESRLYKYGVKLLLLLYPFMSDRMRMTAYRTKDRLIKLLKPGMIKRSYKGFKLENP